MTHLRCSNCGIGTYSRVGRITRVTYRGLAVNMVMEVLVCSHCSEEVIGPGFTYDPFDRLYKLVDSCHMHWQLL